MTWFAIHHQGTGELTSVGTVVADPLPDDLVAVELTDPEAKGINRGSHVWDAASRSVVVNAEWVDPAITTVNSDVLRDRVQTHITGLRTIKNSNGTMNNAQLSNAMRVVAAALLDTMRVLHGQLNETD